MKNRLPFLLSFIFLCLHGHAAVKKVLFIGIDGCRWDALQAASTPAIDGLLSHSIYSGNGLTEYKTWSGTGWSGMLTGVWHTKHGVTDNTFSGADYTQYPDFMQRLETYNPALRTVSVVHWSPINTYIVHADAEVNASTDAVVKAAAVSVLATDNPDVLFVAFDDVDAAGHSYGFSPAVLQYRQAIEQTDSYISEILTALHARTNYPNEDWLIVLTTDHGGNMAGHGGGTLEERTIFTVYCNPAFASQNIVRGVMSSTPTFNEAHFPAGTYATPADQNPFHFGASQDFTIELWVKANAYTGDPAFISNKSWNSGINPGFVISAVDGQFWKVNIGDGNHRLDIQGGTISPGQWHHLAVTFDRDGLMTAYEDGAVVGFEKMSGIGVVSSYLPLRINQDGTGSYSYDFDGSIKDVRIWSAVIPESTLVQWATQPVTAMHPYYNYLLANWKCEEGGGSVLEDASQNLNNCTITGSIDRLLNHSNTFTVYDYTMTPREPDNAVTALSWLCVPIETSWNLDGRSWIAPCVTTSVQDDENENPILFSPNPVTDNLYIYLPEAAGNNLSLSLYDYEGRLIRKLSPDKNQQTISVSLAGIRSGIYLLKIAGEDFYRVEKIVKQ
jgi:hypothetical protein